MRVKRKRCLRAAHVVVLLALVAALAAVIFGRAVDGAQSAEVSTTPDENRSEQAVIVSEKSYIPTAKSTEPPAVSQEPETAPEEKQMPSGRYADVELSQEDIDMLAALVFLEAGNQSPEGQQAVAEVVLNRLIADNFPDTLEVVIFDTKFGVQFTPARRIPDTTPTQAQYDAVEAALFGEKILDSDVVYFSATGENDRVWGTIGNHVFCRQYLWG